MWGKVIGKICDVCLTTSLMSLATLVVVRTVKEVKKELTGGKSDGRDPE